MDDQHFDSLARTVGGPASRRTVVRTLMGAAFGGIAGLPSWLGPEAAAAQCVKIGKRCDKDDRCCGGAKCRGTTCKCTNGKRACGAKCVDLLTDPANCGQCGLTCASGKCLHGTCTCDPFNNQCPTEVDGQCTCGAVVVAKGFEAACTNRNSACDMDRPCDKHSDCPRKSVCLRRCSDPPDPQPNRCSKPCIPV